MGQLIANTFFCITTDRASMVEVLEKVWAVEGVVEADMFYRVYDIIAEVKGDSIVSLKKIITEYIRRIEKVATTTTMLAVKV